MEFNKFRVLYSELEIDMLVVIGLNKIITPSNRCDMVNDYMQTMTRNIKKISIDSSPFIGEPWRLWYHYDVGNCNTFNIPHGFAIETEWKHWFYRNRPDSRLAANNIGTFINSTYSDLETLTSSFDFYEVSDKETKYYDKIKDDIINKYNSPKLFLKHILKISNDYFDIKIDWDSYRNNDLYRVPDLGIYKFLAEENIRRRDIYNAVISK